MELPTGKMNGKIQCPVVEIARKRKGRATTLNRPKPQSFHIPYDHTVKMKDLERYWILSAVEFNHGSISRAAKMLGMARETVYRKVREYNK